VKKIAPHGRNEVKNALPAFLFTANVRMENIQKGTNRQKPISSTFDYLIYHSYITANIL